MAAPRHFLDLDQVDAKTLRQIRMRLFFVELIVEVIIQLGVVSVFHHAQRKAFKERFVMNVMLNRPSL